MTDYERLITAVNIPDQVSSDVQTSVRAVRARARLLDVLNGADQQLPDVAVEEVEADVMEAIREVRSGRSK